VLKPVKNYPALLYTQKQHKTLIIADLHLGWEISLAQKGIHIPSQTSKILQKLLELIDAISPKTLVVLGDVKHTIAKAEPGEWKDVPEFFEAVKTEVNDIQIVRGNHDGNLEPLLLQGMEMHPSTGIVLDSLGLFHGHTWPSRRLLGSATLIMGHVHPTVSFRDAQGFQITTPVWIVVRIRKELVGEPRPESGQPKTTAPASSRRDRFWKPKARQLLIMPCFNDFLGGRPINRRGEHRSYIGPVLRSEAANVERGEVYLLDGTYLGTVGQLRSFS
jgi:putative SbcD/Mre11-related phosphoesterase